MGHGTALPSCQVGCCYFREQVLLTERVTECRFDHDLPPGFKIGKENCSDVYFKTRKAECRTLIKFPAINRQNDSSPARPPRCSTSLNNPPTARSGLLPPRGGEAEPSPVGSGRRCPAVPGDPRQSPPPRPRSLPAACFNPLPPSPS